VLNTVIDANVWISALISPLGKPRKLFDQLSQARFLVCYPEQLLHQLRKAPLKRRLAARLTHDQVERLIDQLERYGTRVNLAEVPSVSRDYTDDAYLACAVAAQCDFIVSGDDDLLCMREYHGIAIITPAKFLSILESTK